jgi:hypothetical protein
MPQTAAQAVEFPKDQHIPLPQRLQIGRQAGMIVPPARRAIFVQVLGRYPCRQQRIPVQIETLTPSAFETRIEPSCIALLVF